jgi:hypothetical protein
MAVLHEYSQKKDIYLRDKKTVTREKSIAVTRIKSPGSFIRQTLSHGEPDKNLAVQINKLLRFQHTAKYLHMLLASRGLYYIITNLPFSKCNA